MRAFITLTAALCIAGCCRDYAFVMLEVRDPSTQSPISGGSVTIDYLCKLCPLTSTPDDEHFSIDEDGIALLRLAPQYQYDLILNIEEEEYKFRRPWSKHSDQATIPARTPWFSGVQDYRWQHLSSLEFRMSVLP